MRRDPKLTDQLKRAASSVPLNLSEGRRRRGQDRVHHYRIAAGSANELLVSLQVAEAWGYLRPDDVEEVIELIDQVLAMLWRLTEER